MRAPALVLYILSSLQFKTTSKGAGGSTSLGSWLRPEWMVKSVTHLGVVSFIQVHV